MLVKLTNSENGRIFIVHKKKVLRYNNRYDHESKVIELSCMADDFCWFCDAMMTKYTLNPTMKRTYHRDSPLSKWKFTWVFIKMTSTLLPMSREGIE